MNQTQAADLIRRVGELARKLALSERQQAQARELSARNARLTKWLLAATAGLVALVIALALVVVELRDVAQANKDAQVTSCENANKTREAQRYLWDTLIDQSAARNPDQTPEQRAYAREFQRFVHRIFAERDCSDLSREYDLPEPPSLTPTRNRD